MRIESKAAWIALTTSISVLASAFGLSLLIASTNPHDDLKNTSLPLRQRSPAHVAEDRIYRGRELFLRNCAHCHGEDARGDEGPALFDLALSDARITQKIKNGIKGEMPKFSSKLDDAAITALIGYLRTLKS
jgi:mono/diheme cytochrome c family protein